MPLLLYHEDIADCIKLETFVKPIDSSMIYES
jgi:hypothetical protein